MTGVDYISCQRINNNNGTVTFNIYKQGVHQSITKISEQNADTYENCIKQLNRAQIKKEKFKKEHPILNGCLVGLRSILLAGGTIAGAYLPVRFMKQAPFLAKFLASVPCGVAGLLTGAVIAGSIKDPHQDNIYKLARKMSSMTLEETRKGNQIGRIY